MTTSVGSVSLPPELVRPRFDDGTFDDPLPLLDHFQETFLDPHAEPVQLALIGPRGSGLTTTLHWLASQVDGPRCALFLTDLLRDSEGALATLSSGLGILFLDTSVTPVAPCAWRAIEQLFLERERVRDVLARSRLVVACPQRSLRGRPEPDRTLILAHAQSNPQRAYLAPWTDDDLLELLGAPRYRERRGELFQAIKGVRHAERLLSRPRTARMLIEAAAQLDPREEVSLGRLYANVLDTLSPWTLERLQALEHDRVRARDLQQLLAVAPSDVDEAASVFEVPRALAAVLIDPPHELIAAAVKRGYVTEDAVARAREQMGEEGGTLLGHLVGEWGELSGERLLALVGLAEYVPDERRVRTQEVELALPGLQHFLQAGHCLSGVALGEVPRGVSASWFPFVPELWTPGVQARLEARLRDPLQSDRSGDAGAASLLWAAGITPPVSGARSYDLTGAHLDGVSLPGVELRDAVLADASLEGARLEGSDLREALLRKTRLHGAVLDGAELSRSHWIDARAPRVSLRGASLERANLLRVSLRGADLQGAHAAPAGLTECDLRGARLDRAELKGLELTRCDLREASFAWANLENGLLNELDLRTVDLRDACLHAWTCGRCNLAEVELDGHDLRHALFLGCDLSGTTFRAAHLNDAVVSGCRAHEACFEGADLRGAVFRGVTFQVGSSRSGLLQGPACEGSRTGFYQEGTTDDAWASPESIRVASFQGADLRGARFENTDLFRVDLRHARLDPELREQAIKADAIV